MSASVTVRLEVPATEEERAVRQLQAEGFTDLDIANDSPEGVSTLQIYEVRNGELEMEPFFERALIPFSAYWDRHAEFNAGAVHGRVTPNGQFYLSRTYDSDTLVPLEEVRKAAAGTPEDMQALIARYSTVEPLSWEDQLHILLIRSIEQRNAARQAQKAEAEVDEALVKLTEELDAYCEQQGLPKQCARELSEAGVTEAQRAWLLDFVARWDSVYAGDTRADAAHKE